MAISYVGTGALAAGTTSVASAHLAGASTDIILAAVSNKPYSSTPTATGYTQLVSGTNGTTANGASSGSVRATVLRKDTTPTASGSDTVSVTSGSPTLAGGVRYATSTGAAWDVATTTAADTDLTGTAFSATAVSDPGCTAGDVIVVVVAANDDTMSENSIAVLSIPGCTVSVLSNGTSLATTTGNDGYIRHRSLLVDSGTSTGAMTFSYTALNSGQSAGAVAIVRLRETTPASLPPRNIRSSNPALPRSYQR